MPTEIHALGHASSSLAPALPMVDLLRRRFFGTCAIILGAWETGAYAGKLPTITDTVRRWWWLRLLTGFWLAGLARHLLGRG